MGNLNLLYVEDDKEALADVVFLLKKSFAKIYTAEDGEEGEKDLQMCWARHGNGESSAKRDSARVTQEGQ